VLIDSSSPPCYRILQDSSGNSAPPLILGGEEMSDSEEHHFESKADAGASKTYPQQAGTVRKNGYLVVKNRPCKVYPPFQPSRLV